MTHVHGGKNVSELYHYGIKRRSGRYPWGSGERPFQSANARESKKLIEATKRSKIYRSERKIPKGTKIYRTTLNPNEKLNTASVSYLEPDRNKYKTQISNRDRTKTSYERELVLTEDLKLPSRQHLKNVVNDEIKKDPTLLDDAIKSAATRRIPKGDPEYDYMMEESIYSEKETYRRYLQKNIDYVRSQPLDDRFASLVESFGDENRLRSIVIDNLKESGYNGMVDEHGVGVWRNVAKGADSIIIFDMNKSTKPVNTKELTKEDKEKANDDYYDWARKARNRKDISNW